MLAASSADAAEAAPPTQPSPTRGEGLRRLNLAPNAIARARRLRRNMTDAEKVLWRALRTAFPDLHWRHQVPLGAFTADFCSHRAKLIIEVDGGQHASKASQAYDAERSAFIAAEGYRVLRFWNHDVLADTDGVIEAIAAALCLSPREREGAAKRRKGEGEPEGVPAPAALTTRAARQ